MNFAIFLLKIWRYPHYGATTDFAQVMKCSS